MYWDYKYFFNLKLEVILEFLKNMFLVMDTVNIFYTLEGGELQFWKFIWDRIDNFLFYLKKEFFKFKNLGDLIRILFILVCNMFFCLLFILCIFFY